MVFALVHFVFGFVYVLAVVSMIPVTQYRLTSAYVGGIWALGPDVHHLITGALGTRIYTLHNSPYADLFFFHYTLDGPQYRAHNANLTFISLVVVGIAFLVYDSRFGVRSPTLYISYSPDATDENS